MRSSHRVCAVAFLALSLASQAFAAPDHLICRDAKESAPHSSYAADVLSAAYAGTGCVVKAPAKILCEEATVSNVAPARPNGAFHGRDNPGRFVCYALKCPKDLDTVSFPDVIDAHTFTEKGTKLLCAPEVVTAVSPCATPGGGCNSCGGGCAEHLGGGSPNVCINPGLCLLPDIDCTNDSGCPGSFSCVTDPNNSMQTACCAACAP